jgi:hypothetical protein
MDTLTRYPRRIRQTPKPKEVETADCPREKVEERVRRKKKKSNETVTREVASASTSSAAEQTNEEYMQLIEKMNRNISKYSKDEEVNTGKFKALLRRPFDAHLPQFQFSQS